MGSTPAAPGSNVTGEAIGGNATFDSNYLQEKTNSEDAIWILSCTFVIFTMQSVQEMILPARTAVSEFDLVSSRVDAAVQLRQLVHRLKLNGYVKLVFKINRSDSYQSGRSRLRRTLSSRSTDVENRAEELKNQRTNFTT
ncbi:hypothetical protein NP493_13g13016 [Ridgeia piscesae]|uniref:Uncharacterized protein n=1 Tax=Ridgeia piscesae TaxID=27915 RepID=A0AAD9ULA0_RIDPI|nr:hypothetical protein NP493_13g13016 [Ridgeia piscesae]